MCRRNRAYYAGGCCSSRKAIMLPPSYQTAAIMNAPGSNLVNQTLPVVSEKGLSDGLPSYERVIEQETTSTVITQPTSVNGQSLLGSQYLRVFQQAVVSYRGQVRHSRCMKKRAARNLVKDLYHITVDHRSAEGERLGYKERKQIRRELEPVKQEFQNIIN